jgi:SAM-dependent methyltransferase
MTTTSTTTNNHEASRYTFNNDDAEGPHQLRILADILDEHSTSVLAGTGVAPGWQCLDVGPGAGTITTWLAERVRPAGHVTALDLDPQHLHAAHNVTVRRGDVRTVELPENHFDLIHARLVLVHLAERETVLGRLVNALRPGGILVLSEWDLTRRDWLLRAPTEAAAKAFDTYQSCLIAELQAHGADPGWARRAPLAMRDAGMVEVHVEVHTRLWTGGEPGCLLHVSNANQLHTALVARGTTADQLHLLHTAMHDADTLAYCYWMFTSIGRRPHTDH